MLGVRCSLSSAHSLSLSSAHSLSLSPLERSHRAILRAGKSHSMMGYPGAEGIVPRACREIFARIASHDASEGVTFKASEGDLTAKLLPRLCHFIPQH